VNKLGFQLGPHTVENGLLLAPMVGVSDKPFREICADQGASLTFAEMLTSNADLWHNERNRLKQAKAKTNGPHAVQIAGSDPDMMANAARLNADSGAQIIDINMGCPAKKVLKKAAGSALLKDPLLVASILQKVVSSVEIPVTLKIRTGWSPEHRNGVEIARIAQDCGVQMLSVHGRTKACRFKGEAEYHTIASIKQAVQIPVIANGDIDSVEKAVEVLAQTNADGLMIGRAAQGRPWIFKEIHHFLSTGQQRTPIQAFALEALINSHLHKLYAFYGDVKGVWFARKHVSSYLRSLPQAVEFLHHFNKQTSTSEQIAQLGDYFQRLRSGHFQSQFQEEAA